MPSRRHLFRTAGNVTAAAAIGALAVRGAWLAAPKASGNTSELGRDLRVGYLPITDASALLIAHDGGFWRTAGVASAAPRLFRSWDSLAQAIVVGEIDIAHLLMPLALQLKFATGAALRVLGWGHTNGSAFVVSQSITQLSQLAGKKVAVPFWWSIHSILTQNLLRKTGLSPVIGKAPTSSEVQLVVLPPAEMVAALSSGQIAGFAVADPFNAVAELKGVGRVHRLLGDVWRDHACCAVVVREELIEKNPQTVHAIADGLVNAQNWLDGHRHDAAKQLSGQGYLPQPVAAIDRALVRPVAEGQIHPQWHGEKLGFEAFPHPSYTHKLVELMQETVVDGDRSFLQKLDPESAHKALVDDRFITAALRRAGKDISLRREEVAA